jgi:hypothetical protein
MQEKHIKAVLYVTGAITMLPLFQFLSPEMALSQQGLAVSDETGMLFARHWGLLVFCVGALMVYAANRPAARRPVIISAAVEKIGLIALVGLSWNNPALQGLHLSVFFDSICVVLYALILLSMSKSRPT